MRCVECSAPVDSLYTCYSKDNFRLTQCPRCLEFADRYVEYDLVLIGIDALLIKPQVYRHLLFNKLALENDGLNPVTIKLALLQLAFDIYLAWYRADTSSLSTSKTHQSPQISLMQTYLSFGAVSLVGMVVTHAWMRWWTRRVLGYREGNAVSTALVISSGAKVLSLLMVVWRYAEGTSSAAVRLPMSPTSGTLVDAVVLLYNIEAVRLLIPDARYLSIAALVSTALAAKVAVCAAVSQLLNV
ncbi:sterol homeostasis protein [Savitreella phatthalungensis]